MAGGFIGMSVIKVTGSWLMALLAGGGVMAVLALMEEKFLLRWARGNDLIETLISLSVAIDAGWLSAGEVSTARSMPRRLLATLTATVFITASVSLSMPIRFTARPGFMRSCI